MTLWSSGDGWLLWYAGLLFAGIVLPAKLLARYAGVRIMNDSFAVLMLKKMIRTLFGHWR
jgi:hypothetical protein